MRLVMQEELTAGLALEFGHLLELAISGELTVCRRLNDDSDALGGRWVGLPGDGLLLLGFNSDTSIAGKWLLAFEESSQLLLTTLIEFFLLGLLVILQDLSLL